MFAGLLQLDTVDFRPPRSNNVDGILPTRYGAAMDRFEQRGGVMDNVVLWYMVQQCVDGGSLQHVVDIN